MDDYGYLGDDITLGGDPDTGPSSDEKELREIERQLLGFSHGPRSDGVLGAASTPEPQLRPAIPNTRKLSGTYNVGGGRPRKDGLANPRPVRPPQARGSDASGTGGVGPKHHPVPAPAQPNSGPIPRRRGAGTTPRVRRKGLESLRLLGPIEDRLGTRNSARGIIKGTFQGANFNATLKELKFNTAGDLDMRIIIPYEQADQGVKFKDAFGVDLDFIVKRHDYNESS